MGATKIPIYSMRFYILSSRSASLYNDEGRASVFNFICCAKNKTGFKKSISSIFFFSLFSSFYFLVSSEFFRSSDTSIFMKSKERAGGMNFLLCNFSSIPLVFR